MVTADKDSVNLPALGLWCEVALLGVSFSFEFSVISNPYDHRETSQSLGSDPNYLGGGSD